MILDKVKQNLEGWKSTCLSRAGHLTLTKVVISNIAIFSVQAQRLTSKTHKETYKRVRRCIWGSSPSKRKVHLLDWENTLQDKGDRGCRVMKIRRYEYGAASQVGMAHPNQWR